MEKNEIHAVVNKNDAVYSFFARNRKPFFISGIAIVVLLAGFIAALIVRDAAQKDATAKLDILVERYNELKGSLTENTADSSELEDSAGTETVENLANAEAVESLLTDLQALGKSAAGYPAARAWFMAADIYHERNEWQTAQDAWLAAASKGGSTHITPVCLFNAAVAGEAAGNPDSALSNYKKALTFTDFPAAARAQFSVGRLAETGGDTEAAVTAYRALIDKWPAETDWVNLAQSRLLFLDISSPE
ncbi:MAG: tetratricopeptide repeat protein [Spirochaetaceae bacterium]|jgi:tetratricopeptide (TPR) repeat protein|nr:tetratricopeptide repeat protein [Spirochaetaceae bacterium]